MSELEDKLLEENEIDVSLLRERLQGFKEALVAASELRQDFAELLGERSGSLNNVIASMRMEFNNAQAELIKNVQDSEAAYQKALSGLKEEIQLFYQQTGKQSKTVDEHISLRELQTVEIIDKKAAIEWALTKHQDALILDEKYVCDLAKRFPDKDMPFVKRGKTISVVLSTELTGKKKK